jgi:hypothetical protein
MIKLVKYNYDAFPEKWKKDNPNPFRGVTFALLGSVKNMRGHSYVQDIKTGKGCILDTDNLIELSPDEL